MQENAFNGGIHHKWLISKPCLSFPTKIDGCKDYEMSLTKTNTLDVNIFISILLDINNGMKQWLNVIDWL